MPTWILIGLARHGVLVLLQPMDGQAALSKQVLTAWTWLVNLSAADYRGVARRLLLVEYGSGNEFAHLSRHDTTRE
jgi:hypothetical protein